MEEREIEKTTPEVDSDIVSVTSVPSAYTGEAPPKKTRRVWRVVAVIAGIILLVGLGAVLGGGLVYARMGGRGARHAQIVVVPRVIERERRFVIPHSPRVFMFDDMLCHLDLDASLEVAEHGVLVLEVMDDTPASAAGLEVCDVITHVDGKAVEDAEALVDAITEHEPGDEVTLTVFRPGEGETTEIAVTLTEHPDDEAQGYLGVRVGGAFKIDVVCDGEECDSRILEHLDDIAIEMDDELDWSPGEEASVMFPVSPGRRAWPRFWLRRHSENDQLEFSIGRGDDF